MKERPIQQTTKPFKLHLSRTISLPEYLYSDDMNEYCRINEYEVIRVGASVKIRGKRHVCQMQNGRSVLVECE